MRILIADDESLIRMGLRRMLEEAGHQVVAAASDGRTAVRMARDLAPELAILDIKMPGWDGLEAARRIVAELPIPVIILTAYGQRELVQEATRAPVMAYLVKPVQEAELLATLEIAATRFSERLRMAEQAADMQETLEDLGAAPEPTASEESEPQEDPLAALGQQLDEARQEREQQQDDVIQRIAELDQEIAEQEKRVERAKADKEAAEAARQ